MFDHPLPHFWPMQKGAANRAGHATFVMPDISLGPTWRWKASHGDVFRHTPLIDSSKNLYVTSIAGRTFKLSTKGLVLWQHYTGDRGGVPVVPILVRDRLFLVTRHGFFISLDISSGLEESSVKVAPSVGTDTGCLLELDGLVIFAVFDPIPVMMQLGAWPQELCWNNRIIGVNASTGEVGWKFKPFRETYNFQAASNGDGTFVFQDRTGSVYRVSARDGRLVWFGGVMDQGSFTTAASVLFEDRVFAVSNFGAGGLLHVYDVQTGAQLWSQNLPLGGNQAVTVGRDAHGAVVIIGVGDNPGKPIFLSVFDSFPNLLWLAQFANWLSMLFPSWFARKQSRGIGAFDAHSGAMKWVFALDPYQMPAAAGDADHVGGRLQGLINGSNPNNDVQCLPDSNAQPVIDGRGTCFVPFQDGNLFALRDKDGDGKISSEEVKIHKMEAAAQASPAMAPGLLAVLDCSGNLEVFESV